MKSSNCTTLSLVFHFQGNTITRISGSRVGNVEGSYASFFDSYNTLPENSWNLVSKNKKRVWHVQRLISRLVLNMVLIATLFGQFSVAWISFHEKIYLIKIFWMELVNSFLLLPIHSLDLLVDWPVNHVVSMLILCIVKHIFAHCPEREFKFSWEFSFFSCTHKKVVYENFYI